MALNDRDKANRDQATANALTAKLPELLEARATMAALQVEERKASLSVTEQENRLSTLESEVAELARSLRIVEDYGECECD